MSRIAKDWDDKHLEGPPPPLMGQLFHRFEAQSFRPSALLHAARLGVEREPDRHVRELARQHLVRWIQGAVT
jgi:hypothetical protein